MTDEVFIRRYRFAVLGGVLAWRLVLFNPLTARGLYDALEGLVYGIGIGLLPFAALATLASWIRLRWLLASAAIVAFGMDVAALVAVWASSSSRASIIVLLVPLFELVTVVPAAALLRVAASRSAH